MIRLPDSNVRILAPVSGLDYYDVQSIELAREIKPIDVWNITMRRPQPLLKIAFQLRDAISSLFGVRRIGGFSTQETSQIIVGEKLDFFLIEFSDENALVLTERDRHLDVMTCISTDGTAVSVTSSVQTHNLFGRIYMIPVGIAHRWIVRGMLKRLRKEVS